ncbi:hypothetical protein PGTUg99_033325 [Puccinia graminis f. sp. tritici]|uniref:Uncharacterized protein n=1 Tax=Puccinia graminis f. sp. tritici TaxID=56615 RepID=A0A5B0N1B7_PUCGR|nr:hypothetical protein PGTUg99_033325 [Puccinia graminis f. sp. tritici]
MTMMMDEWDLQQDNTNILPRLNTELLERIPPAPPGGIRLICEGCEYSLFQAIHPIQEDQPKIEEQTILLSEPDYQELYYGPLSNFISQGLHQIFPNLHDQHKNEFILHFTNLEIKVPEDNIYSKELSLFDIDRLHIGARLPDRLMISLEKQPRLVHRFNILANYVAELEPILSQDELSAVELDHHQSSGPSTHEPEEIKEPIDQPSTNPETIGDTEAIVDSEVQEAPEDAHEAPVDSELQEEPIVDSELQEAPLESELQEAPECSEVQETPVDSELQEAHEGSEANEISEAEPELLGNQAPQEQSSELVPIDNQNEQHSATTTTTTATVSLPIDPSDSPSSSLLLGAPPSSAKEDHQLELESAPGTDHLESGLTATATADDDYDENDALERVEEEEEEEEEVDVEREQGGCDLEAIDDGHLSGGELEVTSLVVDHLVGGELEEIENEVEVDVAAGANDDDDGVVVDDQLELDELEGDGEIVGLEPASHDQLIGAESKVRVNDQANLAGSEVEESNGDEDQHLEPHSDHSAPLVPTIDLEKNPLESQASFNMDLVAPSSVDHQELLISSNDPNVLYNEVEHEEVEHEEALEMIEQEQIVLEPNLDLDYDPGTESIELLVDQSVGYPEFFEQVDGSGSSSDQTVNGFEHLSEDQVDEPVEGFQDDEQTDQLKEPDSDTVEASYPATHHTLHPSDSPKTNLVSSLPPSDHIFPPLIGSKRSHAQVDGLFVDDPSCRSVIESSSSHESLFLDVKKPRTV